MEMENIRINWAPVLESQVSHIEKVLPGRGVRETFQKIIEDLNANRIKSRAIIANREPVGYAYYMTPDQMTDRILGNVGFVDPESATGKRAEILISWLKQEGASMGRIVMINGIFNGNDETEKVLEEGGFTRMEREMMELDLRNFPESDPVVPEGYSIEGLAGLNIDDYLRVESDAYKGTHDEILFSTKEDERLLLNRAIFEGGYGDIITNVSRIAKHNGEIAGACIVTNRNSEQQVYGYPLIIDVFVAAGHRKKGLARAILHDTARRAKVYGLSRLFLWVNLENEARTLYENTGFSESDYPHEIIYYLMP